MITAIEGITQERLYRATTLFEYCDPNRWVVAHDAYTQFRIITLPVLEKKPLLGNWQKLRSPYPITVVDRIERNYSHAQVGIAMGQNELAVVDLDIEDPSFLVEALEVFGQTPVIVQTRRGFHLYYRSFCWLRSQSGNCIDLKAGSSFVVAPLTIYEADRSPAEGCYQFISQGYRLLSFEEALGRFALTISERSLPLIDMDKAHVFFE